MLGLAKLMKKSHATNLFERVFRKNRKIDRLEKMKKRYLKEIFLFSTFFFAIHDIANATFTKLKDALINTYKTNPELQKEREELDIAREKIAQARARFMPELSLHGDHKLHKTRVPGDREMKEITTGGDVILRYNLFESGAAAFGMKRASNEVQFQQETFKKREQEILFEAIKAYLDLWYTVHALEIVKKNEEFYEKQLEATQVRLQVGDATKTDVSLSSARLAEAKARRIESEANLENQRIKFLKITGLVAGQVEEPTYNINIPQDYQSILQAALQDNPLLRSSDYLCRAAEQESNIALSGFGPKIDLQGSVGHHINKRGSHPESNYKDSAISLTATIPLYQKGLEYSSLREKEKKIRLEKSRFEDTQRTLIEHVGQTWQKRLSILAKIEQYKNKLEYTKLTLKGAEEEVKYGSKNLFELLDARQKHLEAQLELLQSKRDEFESRCSLAVLMGHFTAKDLDLLAAKEK